MPVRIAIFCLGLACVLRAADAPAAERLIDLNLIALDAHGQPVTDLRADEIELTDAGKPEKLALFRRLGASPAVVAPLGPGQFSNRVNGESSGATVLLFDLMNEGFGSRGIAANQIIKNLQGLESAASLYFYLLTINGKLIAVRGIPEEGAPPPDPAAPPWTRQIKPVLDQALQAVTVTRSVDIDVALRVQLTYTALEDLGEQLGRLAGRKNVVWVTDGVPIALGEQRSDSGVPIDFTPYLRKLAGSLDRDGVSIYPVRQVMLGSPDEIGAESGAGQTGGAGTGAQSIATLDEFAEVTGGRPSSDKDIGRAVRQAMIDLRTSYQIGYYPSEKNWDGKYHKLRLSTKRKGVHLQAKTGYYAAAQPAGTRAQDAFLATSRDTYDAAEIGLRATVSGDQLTVRVDVADLALAQNGDRYSGQLRVQTAGYSAEGRVEASAVTPVDLNFDSAQRDQALQQGIEFAQRVKLQGESKFRVMVFDRNSNSIGSVTVPAKAFAPAAR